MRRGISATADISDRSIATCETIELDHDGTAPDYTKEKACCVILKTVPYRP